MPLNGIDVSDAQHGIRIADLVPRPDFVIIKTTGSRGYVNPDRDRVAAECEALGIPYAFYHYIRDLSGEPGDARSNAEWVYAQTKKYKGRAGIALDWESVVWDDPLLKDAGYAAEWLGRMEELWGSTPGFYGDYRVLTNGADWSLVKATNAWKWRSSYVLDRTTSRTRIDGFNVPDTSLLAATPAWPDAPAMWQYTSSGRLGGWDGDLDLNVFFGDMAGLRRLFGITAESPSMSTYYWPLLEDFPVTQEFGDNPGGENPAGGHTGMDFAAPEGTPIIAPAAGKILWADWVDETWEDNLLWLRGGISVVLDCGDTEPTFVFGHCSRTDRNAGEWVNAGDVIGYTGNTGHSSGPHLHFEALAPGYVLNSPTLGRCNPRNYCNAAWTGVQPLDSTITPIEEDMLTQQNIDDIVHAVLVAPAWDNGPQVSQVLKDLNTLMDTLLPGEADKRTAGYTFALLLEISAGIKALADKQGVDPAVIAQDVADRLAAGVDVHVTVAPKAATNG